jgi:hypothetical protein
MLPRRTGWHDLHAIRAVYGLQNAVGPATYTRRDGYASLDSVPDSPEILGELEGGDQHNARLLMRTRIIV